MDENEKSERFLNLYRELEDLLEARFGVRSGAVQTYAAGEGARYREELTLFRETRNLLSHHGKVGGAPPVVPSEGALKTLETILEAAAHPPVALTVATKMDRIYCVRGDEEVTPLFGVMKERGFSHLPVVNERRILTGVFSVGSLFAYFALHPERTAAGLRISDLSEVLAPDDHPTEAFIFVDRGASAYSLRAAFQGNGPSLRRVVAAFVTADGTANSPLLGMITPWDVLREA